jgi:hypothetical protein
VCLYPTLIKNRKYLSNKKNKGIIPKCKDERTRWVPVGCGKCMECRKQKAREWQVRLSEDIRENKNGKFVTLTFSDESINELDKLIDKKLTGYNRDNAILTKAVRRFTERWRKKYKKTIRHWLVSELGETNTERIHLHGILWTDEVEEIEKIWNYGYVYIGDYVSDKTINYIIKYVNKSDKLHKEYKSKIFASKGLGKNYTKRRDFKRHEYKKGKTVETYRTRNGMELALPVYYRNKIFSEEEKELLWLEKLDKEERWVDGVKVDVSKNDEEYYKLLEIKRMKNKRLGFGDDEINWEQRLYERNKRNLKRLERIEKLTRKLVD